MWKRVLHSCRICLQHIDCDRRAIKIHLNYHSCTIRDYIERYGLDVDDDEESTPFLGLEEKSLAVDSSAKKQTTRDYKAHPAATVTASATISNFQLTGPTTTLQPRAIPVSLKKSEDDSSSSGLRVDQQQHPASAPLPSSNRALLPAKVEPFRKDSTDSSHSGETGLAAASSSTSEMFDNSVPITKVVGDLCVFRCKFCSLTMTCWLKM